MTAVRGLLTLSWWILNNALSGNCLRYRNSWGTFVASTLRGAQVMTGCKRTCSWLKGREQLTLTTWVTASQEGRPSTSSHPRHVCSTILCDCVMQISFDAVSKNRNARCYAGQDSDCRYPSGCACMCLVPPGQHIAAWHSAKLTAVAVSAEQAVTASASAFCWLPPSSRSTHHSTFVAVPDQELYSYGVFPCLHRAHYL